MKTANTETLKYAAMAAALLLPMAAALAESSTVRGPVWEIAEPDMRIVMAQQAAEVDWAGRVEELQERSANYTAELNGWLMPQAERTRTKRVDPSVVVREDIEAPMPQPDGSYRWEVLVEAGETINPLDYQRPRSWFLLFDGEDDAQVEMVEELVKRWPYLVRPVLSRGDPGELAEEWEIPVFFADEVLLDRFQFEAVPSVAGISEESPRRISVTKMAPPWIPDEVEGYLR